MKKINTTMIVGIVISVIGLVSILSPNFINYSDGDTSGITNFMNGLSAILWGNMMLLGGMVTLLIGSLIKNYKNKKTPEA
jgi:drug/metabolite transporter (DMT)-like permease